MGVPAKKYRFEQLADFDIDSAVVQVGLHHYTQGPPSAAIIINTGAVAVNITAHHTDVANILDALKAVEKRLIAEGL